MNVPGTRLDEARRAYDFETAPRGGGARDLEARVFEDSPIGLLPASNTVEFQLRGGTKASCPDARQPAACS